MYYSKDKEKDILERWKTQAVKNGDLNFVYDGLLYRGKRQMDKNGNWYYSEGDEAYQWGQTPSILFLTKYPNGNANDDIRTWTGQPVCSENQRGQFYFNLMRWAYCIYEVYNYRTPKSFSTLENKVLTNTFDTIPIAIVNITKEAKKGMEDTYIDEYFSKDGYLDLLREEIELFFDAQVIFCGGNKIFKILSKLYDSIEWVDVNFKKNEKYIYSLNLNGKVIMIINGYSPKYPGSFTSALTEEEAYQDLIDNLLGGLRQIQKKS